MQRTTRTRLSPGVLLPGFLPALDCVFRFTDPTNSEQRFLRTTSPDNHSNLDSPIQIFTQAHKTRDYDIRIPCIYPLAFGEEHVSLVESHAPSISPCRPDLLYHQ